MVTLHTARHVRASNGALIAALLLAAALAGCVSGDPEGTGFGDDGQFDVNRGTLNGTVIDEELRPVAGAQISLGEGEPLMAETDEAGRFLLRDLPSGKVDLFIQADGYFHLRSTIDIVAGQVTKSSFTLVKLPSQDPYVELFILSGYSTCEFSFFLVVTTYETLTGQDCPIGEPKRSVIQNISESWRYGVVELDWETADSFALYIADDLNCLTSDPCYGIKFGGHPPLRLDMAPGDEELARQWASDGEITYPEGSWEMWANVLYIGMYRDEWGSVTDEPVCRGALNYSPGCPSWGVSTGIQFETYVSVFNWERPSDVAGYSGLPDA